MFICKSLHDIEISDVNTVIEQLLFSHNSFYDVTFMTGILSINH